MLLDWTGLDLGVRPAQRKFLNWSSRSSRTIQLPKIEIYIGINQHIYSFSIDQNAPYPTKIHRWVLYALLDPHRDRSHPHYYPHSPAIDQTCDYHPKFHLPPYQYYHHQTSPCQASQTKHEDTHLPQ